jgi:DNA-binding MarR family transcriptional regulator
VTRLAAVEGVRKPPMSRALASLEQQGLVRREADGSDGRQALIHLTPLGEETLTATCHLVDDWYKKRFTRLDDTDIAAIQQAVSAINRLTTEN